MFIVNNFIYHWISDELFLVYTSIKFDPINFCHRHEISFVFANVVMEPSSHDKINFTEIASHELMYVNKDDEL